MTKFEKLVLRQLNLIMTIGMTHLMVLNGDRIKESFFKDLCENIEKLGSKVNEAVKKE